MGKQTENKNNKYSKKNYSFTGHRTIGDNKSSFVNSNTGSESSEGNTTEEMMRILESDVKQSHSAGMNQMSMPNMNQMGMNQMGMNQMNMPGMNQMNMPGMNQMNMPGMNQMNMPGMNQMGMPGMNQMNMMGAQPRMEDIDPLMVNTLAPINNASMNIEANTLMTPMQMANNMGSIANLSKLSNVSSYNNNFMGTEQNLTEQNSAGQFGNPMNQQLMGMLNNQMGSTNQMGMLNNQMGNTNQMGMSGNNLKNLASLNSIKMY